MKKVLILFLCIGLVFCMMACGETEDLSPTSESAGTVKDVNVSVTIEGITYNEKDYNHFLDITINNKTNKTIGGYVSSLYLDGYSLDGLLSINIAANTTIKQQIQIERNWIIYYYNLCNMTEVDNVTLSLKILDKETYDDMGIVTTTGKIEKYKFDETKFSDPNFKADINATVYSDDKCEVTLLTFYTDYLSKPTAYFLLENKNIEDKVYFEYKSEDPESFSEIIEDANNGGKSIFAEVNGKTISCGKVIPAPSREGISEGNKAIFPVEIDIQEADISLNDISSFKMGFVIENQDALNSIKYAEVNLNWAR